MKNWNMLFGFFIVLKILITVQGTTCFVQFAHRCFLRNNSCFIIIQYPLTANLCEFQHLSADRWIPIQVRTDTSRDGSVWNRKWEEYAVSFEVQPSASTSYLAYWIGLRRLHALTSTGDWDLVVLLEWESGARTRDGSINPEEIRKWGPTLKPFCGNRYKKQNRKLSTQIRKNKAVYTTTPVAGGWAGAEMSWAGAVMIWAGALAFRKY